jgi:hypothetical protein
MHGHAQSIRFCNGSNFFVVLLISLNAKKELIVFIILMELIYTFFNYIYSLIVFEKSYKKKLKIFLL